jgi:hypothetical protein
MPTVTPTPVQLVVRGDGEDYVPVPGRQTEAHASGEAVGYATDPKRRRSATPETPIEAVDGVADRPRNLSLA